VLAFCRTIADFLPPAYGRRNAAIPHNIEFAARDGRSRVAGTRASGDFSSLVDEIEQNCVVDTPSSL
jgi:hypothetical protein